MTVLLDTDILVDVATDRAPFATPAANLLDALEQRPGSAFVAWHSLSNFYYLVAPASGKKPTRDFLLDLTRFIKVAPTTTASLRYAVRLPMPDFEDALQVAAAAACNADLIATRNIRDYARSPIRALTPSAVLEQLRAATA